MFEVPDLVYSGAQSDHSKGVYYIRIPKIPPRILNEFQIFSPDLKV